MFYLYNKDSIQCLECSEKLNEVNELHVFFLLLADTLGLEITVNFLYFFSIKIRQYICIFEEFI